MWRQSEKYRIPRIAYVNKMDKLGADFDKSVRSLESKLSTVPLVVHLPIGRDKSFVGLVDLVQMRALTWHNDDQGRTIRVEPLTPASNATLYERAYKRRLALVERLAQASEPFADLLLDKFNMSFEQMSDNALLAEHVRSASMTCACTPVLCGSSFRNVGVQALMDAVCDYLPSPLDLAKNAVHAYYDRHMSAVCFKIVHDHQKARKRVDKHTVTASLATSATRAPNEERRGAADDDILSYVRVYNGELHARAKIFNANKRVHETVDKIYIPFSNQLKQVTRESSQHTVVPGSQDRRYNRFSDT